MDWLTIKTLLSDQMWLRPTGRWGHGSSCLPPPNRSVKLAVITIERGAMQPKQNQEKLLKTDVEQLTRGR